jgi:selenium-binding protein 1
VVGASPVGGRCAATGPCAPGPRSASPREVLRAPREEVLYVTGTYRGTGIHAPDFLAVVDVHPESDTYGRVVHRTAMPHVGDELRACGWPSCGPGPGAHDTLIVSGLASSRLYVVHVGSAPRRPEVVRVLEPEVVVRKTGYTHPLTVRGLPGGIAVVAMLGDREGEAPGGFAVLDAKDFDLLGRWEEDKGTQELMYDFWCHPRAGVVVSSEWAAPRTFEAGLRPEDVRAGRYGHRLHVWDLRERRLLQSLELGPEGLAPLEVRGLHDPAAAEGYVAAALSGTLWYWHADGDGGWAVERVGEAEPPPPRGAAAPAQDVVSAQALSLDDRFLYVSCWLRGEVRQYDVRERGQPRLHSVVRIGGLGERTVHRGQPLVGGPRGLQLSLDGRRLYVTNSLCSSWDDQFYPGLASWLLKIEIDPEHDDRMRLDPDFLVDFAETADGPARVGAIRLAGGDPTTEVFP